MEVDVVQVTAESVMTVPVRSVSTAPVRSVSTAPVRSVSTTPVSSVSTTSVLTVPVRRVSTANASTNTVHNAFNTITQTYPSCSDAVMQTSILKCDVVAQQCIINLCRLNLR